MPAPISSDFTGIADGSAWPTKYWTVRTFGQAGVTAPVMAERGRHNMSTVTNFSGVKSVLNNAASANFDATYIYRVDSTASRYIFTYLRGVDSSNLIYIQSRGNAITLWKTVAGTNSLLATFNMPVAFAGNTDYRVKLSLSGSNIRVKHWNNASAEPAAWGIDAVETDFQTDAMPFELESQTTATSSFFSEFDNVVWTPPVATNRPLLSTLKDNFSAKDTALWDWSSVDVVHSTDHVRINTLAGYPGLYSNSTYSFHNSEAFSKVVALPTGTSAEAIFTFSSRLANGVIDPRNSVQFIFVPSNGRVHMRVSENDVITYNQFYTYNIGNTPFYRMSTNGADIIFTDSPDGFTWTERGRLVGGYRAWMAEGSLWFQSGYSDTSQTVSGYYGLDNVNEASAVLHTGDLGKIKVNINGSWVAKPVKWWNGTAWVAKPLKRNADGSWVQVHSVTNSGTQLYPSSSSYPSSNTYPVAP